MKASDKNIDVLIAQKVVGITHPISITNNQAAYQYGPRPQDWEFLPEYSTDISSAWKIVSVLTSAPYSFDFQIEYRGKYGYVIRFIRDAQVIKEATAETLPLAICLAALQSRG